MSNPIKSAKNKIIPEDKEDILDLSDAISLDDDLIPSPKRESEYDDILPLFDSISQDEMNSDSDEKDIMELTEHFSAEDDLPGFSEALDLLPDNDDESDDDILPLTDHADEEPPIDLDDLALEIDNDEDVFDFDDEASEDEPILELEESLDGDLSFSEPEEEDEEEPLDLSDELGLTSLDALNKKISKKNEEDTLDLELDDDINDSKHFEGDEKSDDFEVLLQEPDDEDISGDDDDVSDILELSDEVNEEVSLTDEALDDEIDMPPEISDEFELDLADDDLMETISDNDAIELTDSIPDEDELTSMLEMDDEDDLKEDLLQETISDASSETAAEDDLELDLSFDSDEDQEDLEEVELIDTYEPEIESVLESDDISDESIEYTEIQPDDLSALLEPEDRRHDLDSSKPSDFVKDIDIDYKHKEFKAEKDDDAPHPPEPDDLFALIGMDVKKEIPVKDPEADTEDDDIEYEPEEMDLDDMMNRAGFMPEEPEFYDPDASDIVSQDENIIPKDDVSDEFLFEEELETFSMEEDIETESLAEETEPEITESGFTKEELDISSLVDNEDVISKVEASLESADVSVGRMAFAEEDEFSELSEFSEYSTDDKIELVEITPGEDHYLESIESFNQNDIAEQVYEDELLDDSSISEDDGFISGVTEIREPKRPLDIEEIQEVVEPVFSEDIDADDYHYLDDDLKGLAGSEAEKTKSESITPIIKSDIGTISFSISPKQLEESLDRVIRNMFSEKIEILLNEVIENVVNKEIQKLKNILLNEINEDE